MASVSFTAQTGELRRASGRDGASMAMALMRHLGAPRSCGPCSSRAGSSTAWPVRREEHVVERGLAHGQRVGRRRPRGRGRGRRRARRGRRRRPSPRRCGRRRSTLDGAERRRHSRARAATPRRRGRRRRWWRPAAPSARPAVPWAITWPWSMTTIWSASRSASSRYCVVSSTVVPCADELVDDASTGRCGCSGRGRWSARRGTAPAGGGRGRRRGRAGAACRPSRSAPAGRRRRSRPKRSSSSSAAVAPCGLGLVGEPADEAEVLAAGEVLVDGGVLAGQADALAHRLRVLGHVDAEHGGPPGVGAQDRGEDAHGGRLAGTVGTEQAEDGAGGDRRSRCRRGRRRCRSASAGLRRRWPGDRGGWSSCHDGRADT